MGQNLLQSMGAQPQKPTKFVSLFTSRFMSGLFTNRSLLRGPLSFIYSDYYHAGATDALCDGLNSEVSIRQTMIRRPGNPVWCSVATTEAIDSFYSFHKSDGTISVIADGITNVYVATPSSLTSIFVKATTAGEATFQGIDKTLYIADGVDTVKYIPGTTNPRTGKPLWNWGGAAPTVAPTLRVTSTGSSGIAWVASTMWTTMGMLTDANGNIQQLTSVNASGTNTTQLGITGNGAPAFVNTPGVSITETSGTPITWQNKGLVGTWAPGALYYNASTTPSGLSLNLSSIIYDPITKACYVQINGAAGGTRISGNTRPNFRAVIGWSQDNDGQCKWFYCGSLGVPGTWQPSHAYPTVGAGDNSVNSIVTPTSVAQAGIGTATATPLYWWVATTGGTSGTSAAYIPNWATTPGFSTNDGSNLIWNCVCNGTWIANTSYFPWSASATSFGAVKDTNGNIQICISQTGPSGAVQPTWNTGYGNTTFDGTGSGSSFVGVIWACVGSSLSWAANTQWYLPTGGFVPPQPSQAYGGATLSQAGINEYVINSGKSQTPGPPTWGALLTNTTDGTVTWFSASAFTAAGFAFTTGYGWCYAYKARKLSDSSVLTSPSLQIPGTNSPNITGPLGPPTGCGDGTVTSASPVAQIVGGNVGAQILLTMVGSTDPQFDTISVFRSADGFGAGGPYLFLTDIPMPPMKGALPGIAQIIDFMPDKATALLPGLDPLESAPVNNVNDPPPGQFGSTQFVSSGVNAPTVPLAGTAIQGQVYHQGRLWAFIGNTVLASGGPDTNPGNGFTAWPPINAFPFDSPIVRLLPTASSLIVFTTTDVYLIGGGPAITDYYSQLLVGGVGLLSYNALTVMLGLPYLFTSDRQYITIDPSGGWTRIGHPIGDKLALYNPASVYTTYHSYGDQEHALFLTDGSSEWYRCDSNPTPDSQMTGPIWSPRATIAGGFKAVQSIEVSPGTKKLLIGPSGAGSILARDSTFTTFLDNTSPYSSFFVVGNIVLAHPGQMAQTDFIEADFTQVGTQPTVSVMFDELSPTNGASFEKISNEFVSDPPKMFGLTGTPKTIWMNRYYFGQTTPDNGGTQEPVPAWCKSLQLKVDFGNTDTVQNELLAFTIFGALYQEK